MNQIDGANVRIPSRFSGWVLAGIAFSLAVIVLLVAYWPTVLSLLWVWDHDGTYQYAFLIPPLSLWTAYNLRHELRANPPVPSIWGLVAVVGLCFVWYSGQLLDVNLLRHFALVALFPALIMACWGWQALWVLAFPLAYLVVFAVPWGDGLVGPLQDITAHFAVHALDLTGTPVLLNGREIVTPSAVWMVANACSGVKFFLACGALGCLYAYLMYQRWWKRVLFVALSAVVPVIANGLRVYFTILIGDTWGMKYATGTDHMIFGWQFFGTVLVLLLLVGWFFRDPLLPVSQEYPRANEKMASGARKVIWLGVVAGLIIFPAWAASLSSHAPVEKIQVVAPKISGWSGPQAAASAWKPVFNGAAGQANASYQSSAGGDAVELFHAMYTGKPRKGHTLITFANQLYDSARSELLSSASHQIKLANGRNLTAGELRLSGEAGPRLIWYWYCVDGRCTPSPTRLKLLQGWDVLRGEVPQSSVWAMSTTVGHGGIEEARMSLRAFAQALPETGNSDASVGVSKNSGGNTP